MCHFLLSRVGVAPDLSRPLAWEDVYDIDVEKLLVLVHLLGIVIRILNRGKSETPSYAPCSMLQAML